LFSHSYIELGFINPDVHPVFQGLDGFIIFYLFQRHKIYPYLLWGFFNPGFFVDFGFEVVFLREPFLGRAKAPPLHLKPFCKGTVTVPLLCANKTFFVVILKEKGNISIIDKRGYKKLLT
jgi:hypothetical protein